MSKTINEVIFDLETKKIFSDVGKKDPSKLGISIVSLYKRVLDENLNEVHGKILSFWENEIDNMWEIFQSAQRIIGFNSKGFDIPALKPYAPSYFSKLPHFDIMQKVKEIIGHRISLDALAKETLGRNKIDTGINAVIYFGKGDKVSLAKLKKYCEEDVFITKELYDYALKNHELKFLDKWNEIRKICVDFSFPKEISISNTQSSLF